MTRLLDTGYLETDDPVVASCFLDRRVRKEVNTSSIELVAVSQHGAYLDGDLGDDVLIEYPILIPASVVAEVKGAHALEWTTADAVLQAVVGRVDFHKWLREHTEGGEK